MEQCISCFYIYFKNAYDLVNREVLYNILIEFGIPFKPVMQVEKCLCETYSQVYLDKHLSDAFRHLRI
jgi:hypothetical protein